MRTEYTKNLQKAAKELLRRGYLINESTANCDCGQSRALFATGDTVDGPELKVIECKSCYNKNPRFQFE